MKKSGYDVIAITPAEVMEQAEFDMRLFERMVHEVELMVAMLEKREIDRHRIPLDS